MRLIEEAAKPGFPLLALLHPVGQFQGHVQMLSSEQLAEVLAQQFLFGVLEDFRHPGVHVEDPVVFIAINRPS